MVSELTLRDISGLSAAEIEKLMANRPEISKKVAEALSRTFLMPATHWLDLGNKGK